MTGIMSSGIGYWQPKTGGGSRALFLGEAGRAEMDVWYPGYRGPSTTVARLQEMHRLSAF
jgi:hypothetical protein